MKKPWSVPYLFYLVKKIWPFSEIVARAGLVAAVFAGLFLFPVQAHADRTITSATPSNVTVAPGATITAVVNVTTTGTGANARWRSTGWSISATAPGAVTCVNHANHDGAGAYSETFSIIAPATPGTYNAYFIAYNNDSCSSGASATHTPGAVSVTGTSAPPSATTNAASGVTTENNGASWAATLNGIVSSNGTSTDVSFEYGTTTAYGTSVTATPSTVLGVTTSATAVSADLIGLNCNTLFHYRVKATGAGTSYGSDSTFTTGACAGQFAATDCAAARFGSNLVCTANDVNLTGITVAPGSVSSCVSGTPVTLDIDMTVNFATPDRWDVGIFIANDGKLPTLLPANGGASSCSVDILPTTPPFLDLDGTADTCGDGNSSINDSTLPGGTVPLGDGVKRMTNVTLPCYATPASGGKLFVPFVVSWDNQKSPIGGLCTSNQHPVPNTTSKCNAPLSSVAIEVVVLPTITKTNGGTTINPGANTTYTVVITNNSGGMLLDMVFTDPAVIDLLLTVNSVSCAAAGGATCPITTVVLMQGAGGITIPFASLPNNGSLTFTVNATLSPSAPITNPATHLINTASVSITTIDPITSIPSTHINSDTDDDLIVLAPSAAKSFTPGTITEGAASVLTVTLTNPTASNITGVSFTDTYPPGLVNAASPGESTTCGVTPTVTVTAGVNTLAFFGGTIPAFGSCTVSVYVTSDTAGSYTNTVTTIGGLVSATLTVNVAVFGAFNACDVGTSCTNTTTPTTSYIRTKIAGSPFSLDIVALKTDGSRNTNYRNDVLVELLDASDNSGALDAYNCRSSWTEVIATLSPNPVFANPDNGLKTVGPFITTVSEAYRDVRVRVTNVGGATKKGCSTDRFAIRPNSLAVAPTDATWETATGTRTINNTDATSPGSQASTPNPIHKAGQPFTVTATAMNVSNVKTAKYNVTVAPTAALSACSTGNACTASSSFGTLALGAPAFSAGAVTWNSATYSEVGAFDLTLQDTNFASVDAADTAASCAGYYVCSAATPVGRFVPDHFDTVVELTANLPMPCPTGLIPGCPTSYDGFVYSGQPFSLTVTAKNASGNPTVNYNTTTGLAKTTNLTAWGELGRTTVPTGAGALGVTSVTAFAAGTLTETAEKYTFTTVLTAPTDIYVRAEDTDGVTSQRTSNPTSVEGGVKVVSGRIKIANAYGSELLPLSMTATVQYYNGTNWVTSTTDSVTPFAIGAIVPTIVKGPLTVDNIVSAVVGDACAANVFCNGVKKINLSSSVRQTGSADICLSSPAYLQGTPACASGTPGPNAGRATFGVYKGNNQFIYLREMY